MDAIPMLKIDVSLSILKPMEDVVVPNSVEIR